MRSLSMLACLSLLLPACGSGPTPTDSGLDAGQNSVDAATSDAASIDASAPTDADLSDASSIIDGDVGDASSGPSDAGGTDAGPADVGPADAGTTDACVPPACAAPPGGCDYVGGDLCSCGTLVCADAGVADAGTDAGCLPPPCAAPPPGCQYVGSTLCTCGTLVCSDDCGGEPCREDQYCDYFEATTCGGLGTCTSRPDVCLDVSAPVCGCDGETHDNECVAHRAGTDVAADDPC